MARESNRRLYRREGYIYVHILKYARTADASTIPGACNIYRGATARMQRATAKGSISNSLSLRLRFYILNSRRARTERNSRCPGESRNKV